MSETVVAGLRVEVEGPIATITLDRPEKLNAVTPEMLGGLDAALASIDQSLYESTASDGAGRLRRTWHITLPGMRPVIVLLLILNLGSILTVGFEQFILQRDAVGADTAEVLDTYSYYTGVIGGDDDGTVATTPTTQAPPTQAETVASAVRSRMPVSNLRARLTESDARRLSH